MGVPGIFVYVTSPHDFSSRRRVVGRRPSSGSNPRSGSSSLRSPSRVSSQLFDQSAQADRQASEGTHRCRAVVYFWVAASIVVLIIGLIQFFATFRLYTSSQQQVANLQQQKAEITHQRDELDRQIARWNDKNYVVAQARSRLGFVFPGETSIRVTGAEKYLDQPAARSKKKTQTEPWYQRLKKSWIRSDQGTGRKTTQQKGSKK